VEFILYDLKGEMMSRDKILIYELNKLIENKKAIFKEYPLQTENNQIN